MKDHFSECKACGKKLRMGKSDPWHDQNLCYPCWDKKGRPRHEQEFQKGTLLTSEVKLQPPPKYKEGQESFDSEISQLLEELRQGRELGAKENAKDQGQGQGESEDEGESKGDDGGEQDEREQEDNEGRNKDENQELTIEQRLLRGK